MSDLVEQTPGAPVSPPPYQVWWEQAIPWLGEELVWGVTWWNLLAALLVLILAALVQGAIQRIIVVKVARDRVGVAEEPQHERETRSWVELLLGAALAPLGVLVWTYGFYLALALLLLPFRQADPPFLIIQLIDWLRDFGVFVIVFWFVFRLIGVVDLRLCRRAKASGSRWDRILAPLVGRTLRLILPLLAIIMALPLLPFPPESRALVRSGVSVLVIVFIAAILFQVVKAIEEGIFAQFRVDVDDNLEARKLHTQVTVLKKLAFVLIGVFALASVLMVFESLRQVGTSILASAGIAGVIIGFAAQRSLGTLLAGFQIAITQPIRLDDVVIVEGEWGRIEEITLTYVVVRIWDLRRLVLPIDYFITTAFQNWTRTSADILGTVFLFVDYSVPLAALREEMDRIVEASAKWDRKVKVLQVTNVSERTVEVRILVSASNAGNAFDLRCEVREKMIEFIRDQYPEALPRFRAEISSPSQPGLLPGPTSQ
jgi:small-conductance mechanosensitive channel